MLPSFLIVVSLTVVLGFAGLIILRRRAASHMVAPDSTWAEDFSIEKYRPMQRLLCPEDFVFLKSQPGYHPSIAQALRNDRRRVFRSYLCSVRRDFNRLYAAAKNSVLHSESDQAGVVMAIARQRAIFYWALCLVEVRLILYALGWSTVDIRPVLEALEAMRDAARVLQPVGA